MPKRPSAKKPNRRKPVWNRETVTVMFHPPGGGAGTGARDDATMLFQRSYDNASWHYGGDFPKGLPDRAGGTHIGMFLAWMWLNGHESEAARRACGKELKALRARRRTPGAFLMDVLDGKLVEADFSDDGNAFVVAYFSNEKGGSGRYVDDYCKIHNDPALPSIYHVEDCWENYDKLAKIIDRRYLAWLKRRNKVRRRKPRRAR